MAEEIPTQLLDELAKAEDDIIEEDLEEEILQFIDELKGWLRTARRVNQSNLNFDPFLFMLWKIMKK